MSVFDSVDMTPRAEREQIDPVYLAACQEVAKVEGAGRIATACELVGRIFGVPAHQVLQDAVSM